MNQMNNGTENHSQLGQKVSEQVERNMRKSALKLKSLRSTVQLVSEFLLSLDYNYLVHNNAPETWPKHIYNTDSHILYFSQRNSLTQTLFYQKQFRKEHSEGSLRGKRSECGKSKTLQTRKI